MTKAQRDLLAACYNKHIDASYENVRGYAVNFKKYDNMLMSEIDEVVTKLNAIRIRENTK